MVGQLTRRAVIAATAAATVALPAGAARAADPALVAKWKHFTEHAAWLHPNMLEAITNAAELGLDPDNIIDIKLWEKLTPKSELPCLTFDTGEGGRFSVMPESHHEWKTGVYHARYV